MHPSPRSVSPALCLFALLLAPPLWAGRIEGCLLTEGGAPLPQVVLFFEGPAGRQTTVTGPDGVFGIDLDPGEYRVTADAPGFTLDPSARIAVADDHPTRADLVLRPGLFQERVVVSATRGDAPLSTVGVSASVLGAEQIGARDAAGTVRLLEGLPGLNVAQAGGVGSQASVFVRGGESRFSRVLVDGVPVNQPGGLYDFGSALPLELERVETVRGAASSLYGTDALAGVVHFVSRHARPGESPSLRLSAEGGSYEWRGYEAGSSGTVAGLDWNLGLERLTTANEVDNNAFRENAGALSLGGRLGRHTDLRLVARGEDSTVGTPGPTAYGRPDEDASFDRRDWSVGGRLRRTGGRIIHSAGIGWASSRQLSTDPEDSGCFVPSDGAREAPFAFCDFTDAAGYQNDVARLTGEYQAEIGVGAGQLVTAGAAVERETGEIGSLSVPEELPSPSRTNAGLFLQDRVVLGSRFYLTLGGRVERNGSFGTRAVPRAALAWRVEEGEQALTLRASAGAGIKEPTFLESYGVSFYAKGNPDLRPERSRTADVGAEKGFASGRARASVTLFLHDYLDQIAYQTVDFATGEGTYVNLGKTRARGAEASLEASWRLVRLGADYTYLDGRILESGSAFDPVYAAGRPLLRRPRHTASARAALETGRVRLGVRLVYVGRRGDSDFVGIGLQENGPYARLDARLRVRLAPVLEAFAGGDNLLGRRYQEVLGYPALGRSVRAGLRLHAGGGSGLRP
jgi:outer membrane cobalamin receptor